MGKNRSPRLSVTLSFAMYAALETLCEREAVGMSAMAQRLLRQGLDRTINSAEVQTKIKRHNAHRPVKQWAEETYLDHVIEQQYAKTVNGADVGSKPAPVAGSANGQD